MLRLAHRGTPRTNHLSLSAEIHSAPFNLADNNSGGPRSMDFWKLFWECLYTKICGTENWNVCLNQKKIPYRDRTSNISCTKFCTTRGYCINKRVGGVIFPKDPHQIDRTLSQYHWCKSSSEFIVVLVTSKYPDPMDEMELFFSTTIFTPGPAQHSWYNNLKQNPTFIGRCGLIVSHSITQHLQKEKKISVE